MGCGSQDCFKCLICLEIMKEAFMTKCGHSFCYKCLIEYFKVKKDCPICRLALQKEDIFPNFSLNYAIKNIKKQDTKNLQNHSPSSSSQELSVVLPENNSLSNWQMSLAFRNNKIKAFQNEIDNSLLLDFLYRIKVQNEQNVNRLNHEIKILDQDIEKVLLNFSLYTSSASSGGSCGGNISSFVEQSSSEGAPSDCRSLLEEYLAMFPNIESSPPSLAHYLCSRKKSFDKRAFEEPSFSSSKQQQQVGSPLDNKTKSFLLKKKRIQPHFDDLKTCYFNYKLNESELSSPTNTYSDKGFDEFVSQFSSCSRNHELNVIASLKYGELYPSSSIVSSVELDYSESLIAMAGVTKRIKVFDYDQVINEPVEIHYPICEMSGNSKISCLSWNSYIKNYLVSSDYEGLITLWDVNSGKAVQVFEEHERRAWSVDFSRVDPMKLVSGSDDSKVKLWSINMPRSVLTIENKANVCCVRFNPELSNLLVFGSADHCIHYYDLRKSKDPLHIFQGHKKAVSYVKFLNSQEFVSASTDSTLKLWKINPGSSELEENSLRTFSGHVNEKNFVGLGVNYSPLLKTDFIACGSESNAVYVYVKSLSNPILAYKFKSSSGSGSGSGNLSAFSNHHYPFTEYNSSAAAMLLDNNGDNNNVSRMSSSTSSISSVFTSSSSSSGNSYYAPSTPNNHSPYAESPQNTYGSPTHASSESGAVISDPNYYLRTDRAQSSFVGSHYLTASNRLTALNSSYSNPSFNLASNVSSILSTEDIGDEEGPHFVSSVCWNTKHNTLLAANSQGLIKVLQFKSTF